MKIKHLLLVAALPLPLTACGGSDGDSAKESAIDLKISAVSKLPATVVEGTWKSACHSDSYSGDYSMETDDIKGQSISVSITYSEDSLCHTSYRKIKIGGTFTASDQDQSYTTEILKAEATLLNDTWVEGANNTNLFGLDNCQLNTPKNVIDASNEGSLLFPKSERTVNGSYELSNNNTTLFLTDNSYPSERVKLTKK
ncbi:MAG TPA: hypothetical protein EYH12_01570 [Psychromonas hadalis]|nr:hypothetical protein [Psychromonas hadalis]